mgnify:CR=1 FL=1
MQGILLLHLIGSVCVVICLTVVFREKLAAVSFRFDKSFIKDYLRIGLFGGAHILLDNVVYFAIVCKMTRTSCR